MKKFFFFLLAVCITFSAFSQSDKYVSSMKANLVLFDSGKTSPDYTAIANTFTRIGDAEKTQWLPYYYAALALSTEGWSSKTIDKDANSDQINSLLDKAAALTSNDTDKSEIDAVRNMAYTQQMLVDPQSRWMTYSQKAAGVLQEGLKLNGSNPRLYYLQGMSLFNTPVQFGGGKEKAKPVFAKAVDLYNAEHPKELYPGWGKKQAVDMLAQCQ